MSQRTKGRTVPPPRPPVTIPKRATIPAGDLHLTDGRVLVQGSPRIGSYWLGPDRLSVIATIDATPHGRLLHLSIAYPDHDPSWADIKAIRYAFYPRDIDVMMILPRDEDYVNVHEHCFQMMQTPVAWGLQ